MSTSKQPDRLSLDSVSAPPLVDDQGDVCLAEQEKLSFDEERERVRLQGLINDQQARKSWGERVFWLLVAWLLVDFSVVCFQGFGWGRFHISDSIVITLISTTTVNVLSLGYIVANYLFPKPAIRP